jgi:hypothetical protein
VKGVSEDDTVVVLLGFVLGFFAGELTDLAHRFLLFREALRILARSPRSTSSLLDTAIDKPHGTRLQGVRTGAPHQVRAFFWDQKRLSAQLDAERPMVYAIGT